MIQSGVQVAHELSLAWIPHSNELEHRKKWLSYTRWFKLTCLSRKHKRPWILLLLEELQHHLGCINLCKSWDKLDEFPSVSRYHLDWASTPDSNGKLKVEVGVPEPKHVLLLASNISKSHFRRWFSLFQIGICDRFLGGQRHPGHDDCITGSGGYRSKR